MSEEIVEKREWRTDYLPEEKVKIIHSAFFDKPNLTKGHLAKEQQPISYRTLDKVYEKIKEII